MSNTSEQTLNGEATALELEAGMNLLPGASILGFGINIARASGPGDVTARIIMIDEGHGSTVKKGDTEYLLPANISLVDNTKSYLKFNTFTSRKEFTEHMASDATAEVSAWGFTGEFNAAYSSLVKGKEITAYGLVEANTHLWDLSLQSLQTSSLDKSFAAELAALPGEFNAQTQQAFFDLFNKYGTHVVTTSRAGGRLQYSTAVSQSSGFTQQTAEANIKLEYKSVFVDTSATAHAEWERIDKNWFTSRDAQLITVGGDTSVLAKAVPPNDPKTPVNYQELVQTWAKSILRYPSVIGLNIQPISSVAPVAQSNLLKKALDKYLNTGVYGNNTMLVHLHKPNNITDSTSTIIVGSETIEPAIEPRKGQFANFWVVMADSNGAIKFNKNTLSNDPDEYDKIVKDAKKAANGQRWWTIVLMATVPPRPMSQMVYSWLESCGISLKSRIGYPNWPIHFAATGISNNPEFRGRISMQDSPYFEKQEYATDWQQHVTAEYPLYISL